MKVGDRLKCGDSGKEYVVGSAPISIPSEVVPTGNRWEPPRDSPELSAATGPPLLWTSILPCPTSDIVSLGNAGNGVTGKSIASTRSSAASTTVNALESGLLYCDCRECRLDRVDRRGRATHPVSASCRTPASASCGSGPRVVFGFSVGD